MKRLVINADDFGLCPGVNLGIIHGFREGIVTSATLMVGMPGAAQAFDLARAHPGLGVGLHVNLTAGRPLAADVPSLTGPDGSFLQLPALREQARPDDVRREVQAQVERFLASGLRPTHLDGHHHVHHEIPAVAEAVAAAAGALGVPVRTFGPGFSDGFYGRDQITVEWLLQWLSGLHDGLTELMCHPGYVDPWLLQGSSYAVERVIELATLTDSRIRAAAAANGILLTSYREP